MNYKAVLTTLPFLIFSTLLEAQVTVKITTPPNLPPATVGVLYKLTFQATGTTLPLSWDISSFAPPGGLTIPSGFAIDDPTGVLTGTPTQTGTFMFRVHVDA